VLLKSTRILFFFNSAVIFKAGLSFIFI